MKESLQIHYLEIVTSNVEDSCAMYSRSMGLSFGGPIPELGGAKTALLSNGGMIGIRAPMHDAEEPTVRPYYLVSDIEKAVSKAVKSGADIALPPMEISGYGKCAIIFIGPIQSGFWQV